MVSVELRKYKKKFLLLHSGKPEGKFQHKIQFQQMELELVDKEAEELLSTNYMINILVRKIIIN